MIQAKCGVPPGCMKLGFAGKRFEDPERTLEQCVALLFLLLLLPLSLPSLFLALPNTIFFNNTATLFYCFYIVC